MADMPKMQEQFAAGRKRGSILRRSTLLHPNSVNKQLRRELT